MPQIKLSGDATIIKLEQLPLLFDQLHPHGRSQNVEDDVHDILKAYYDVRNLTLSIPITIQRSKFLHRSLTAEQIALKNFIYHVEFHIVEPFLKSETGPLFGLSSEYVGDKAKMSDDLLEEIAGEGHDVTQNRIECEETIARLKIASQIASDAWIKTSRLST